MVAQLSPTPDVPAQAERTRFYRTLGEVAIVYLLLALTVGVFNVTPPLMPSLWAIISVLCTVAYILVLVYVMRMLAQPALTLRQEIDYCLWSFTLFLVLNPLTWEVVTLIGQGMKLSALTAQLTSPARYSFTDLVVPFFLLLTGAFLGRIIARLIRERNILFPVALIVGLVDFWGLYWGANGTVPTAVSHLGSAITLIASVPKVAIQSLSGPLAVLAHIRPPDSIGLGDFVFLTFFLVCALRLGFSVKRTMWGLIAGLLLVSLMTGFNGQTIFGFQVRVAYLPGLLFMACGVLLANARAWRLTPQEWGMTGFLVLVLGGLITFTSSLAQPTLSGEQTEIFPIEATAPTAVLAKTFMRLQRDHPKDTLLAQREEFLFTVTDSGPQLRVWEASLVGFQPHDPLHAYRNYRLAGTMASTGNACTVKVNCSVCLPPNQAAGQRVLQWMQHANAIPPSVQTMLDQVPNDAKSADAKGSMTLKLQLYPQQGCLYTDKGKLLKTVGITQPPKIAHPLSPSWQRELSKHHG